MKYRAEIDGLRALAVIPVILFHAGFELFSGGFVGVDVFFVISGYLITTILIEDIENKRFSIVSFYERRARRILPALFFVMLVCIPFAWMWMLPNQMKDFSQSLIAVSLFATNILFWRESGYFAATAEEKPLLHTWSLAVEEQYYVLFPIFLILAWRFGKNRVFWLIVVMAVISLLLSEWGWRNKATANFYLAPTRAWELFAGSLAAFVVQKQGLKKNNLLALVGLVAVLFSIFFYDETIPFPSVYALLPVLGVVLLILYAEKQTFTARLLSKKGIVGIGLISYSAYLWHQPLFAFAKIRSTNNPSITLMTILVLSSLMLAYMSWIFVEKPFRNKRLISKKEILFISAFGISLFVFIGLIGHIQNGFQNRLEDYQLEILQWENYPIKIPYRLGDCFLDDDQNYTDFKSVCTDKSANTLIWGDSHSAALASGWRIGRDAHQLTASGCPPIINTESLYRQNCPQINRYVLKVANEKKYETVILHARWNGYTEEQLEKLPLTIRELHSNGIKNIILIGGVPQYHPSLPNRLLSKRSPLVAIESLQENQSNIVEYDEKLQSLVKGMNVRFVSALNKFCNLDTCKVTTQFNGETIPVAYDYGHLTEGGAAWFSNTIDSHAIR